MAQQTQDWNHLVSNFFGPGRPTGYSGGIPLVRNDQECGEEESWSAQVPGFGPEDVTVELQGDQFLVCTLRDEDKKYTRTLALPNNIDPDGVEVEVKNGILTITLPRKRTSRRTVKIKG